MSNDLASKMNRT